MKSVIRIDVPAPLAWKAFQSPSSKRWLAVCDALKSTREGDSLDELLPGGGGGNPAVSPESPQMQHLRDRGWTASDTDEALSSAEVEFDVSWVLIAPKQSA